MRTLLLKLKTGLMNSFDNTKLNVNPYSKSHNYRSMYNNKTRKIIEKRFEKDIDYFKYTLTVNDYNQSFNIESLLLILLTLTQCLKYIHD